MVARAFLAAHVPVAPGSTQPTIDSRAQQQVVKAQSGITLPTIAHVVPECVDALVAIQRANGIDPTLVYETGESSAAFWMHKGVIVPGTRWIDI